MKNIISDLRISLKENIDQKTKESSQRFFKEQIVCYGVKSALVGNISKQYFKLIKDKTKAEIFELCEELWLSGYLEESFIACNWSYNIHSSYETKDFIIFKKWIEKYLNNWASCDTLCNHSIGAFMEMYPDYIAELKILAKSENRWARRAAAVSLIVPAKKGKFLNDVFDLANILLLDKDDMVQKGYGWLLKVASQANQKEIFDFVVNNKKVMPRTALRYAIEKMPDDLKAIAMAK